MDLAVFVPVDRSGFGRKGEDGYRLRRTAVDNHVPLVSSRGTARKLLQALATVDLEEVPLFSWCEHGNRVGPEKQVAEEQKSQRPMAGSGCR